MQILFTALALLISASAHSAVCSRTLTFVDGSILTASQLNAEFNAITNCANSLDNTNLISGAGISPLKIATSIVFPLGGLTRDLTTGGLSVQPDDSTIEVDGASGDVQVKDGGITSAKLADGALTMQSVIFTTPGTANWTAPDDVSYVLACGVGGGGGGGAGDPAVTTRGADGGQGAIEHCEGVTVDPGQLHSYTVGAGGAGSASATGGGAIGGSSSFSGLGGTIIFKGGSGGRSVSFSNPVLDSSLIGDPDNTAGGAGGNSGRGLFGRSSRGYGGGASGTVGGGCTASGGGGGAGQGGSGGSGASPGSTVASAGSGYGAGGGGGSCNVAQQNGGAGYQGYVKLIWIGKP